MATVAEKTADLATLIDDIAATLGGLASWSDADTYVTNDGSTTSWYDNGRVFHNSDAGIYVLFHLHAHRPDTDSSSDYDEVAGVRCTISNDWDATNHHPAGNTNVSGDDPYSSDVGFAITDSYDHVNTNSDSYENYDERVSHAIYVASTDNFDRANNELRQYSVDYYLSAGNDYLNVGAWNSTDGTNGCAGYFTWEYVDNKFWNDGNDPYAAFSQTSAGNHGIYVSSYSWKYFQNNADVRASHPYTATGFDGGEWGIVNPDSADDTFFFKRPVAYLTHQQNVPVAYIEDVLSNDTDEGGAHGDVISHGGHDYRVFRQSGASNNRVHSAALRYE